MNREELTKNIKYMSSLADDLLNTWALGNLYGVKATILDMRVILDQVQSQVKDDLYNNLKRNE